MSYKRYIGIDTETVDPHLSDKGPSWAYGEGRILCTGLADKDKQSAFDGDGGEAVKALLLDKTVCLIGANLAYDIGWLAYSLNISLANIQCGLICVQVAESFIDQYSQFSLDALAKSYLGEKKGIDEIQKLSEQMGFKGDARQHLGKLWEPTGDNDKDNDVVARRKIIKRYVAKDADQARRIWEKQLPVLEREGTLPAFLLNMDMLRLTVQMKQKGVRIDYDRWLENCKLVRPIHDRLESVFFTRWGEVNINSSQQLAALFEQHNIPFKYKISVRGWDKIGFSCKHDLFKGEELWNERKRLYAMFPSVRVEKDRIVLYVDRIYKERTEEQLVSLGYNVISSPNIDKYFINDYKGTYPIVADLSEYKLVKSIISKFLGPKFGRFIVYHGKGEWRIHSNFNVVGARQTGRLSSNAVNLQNIPAKCVLFEKTEYEVDLATMCREIFLPEKGELFVKLDFSGQENRLQAHFAVGASGKRIRAMYKENPRLDEHQFVANVSGLEEEYGHTIGRKYAKNVRFGLSYGMQTARMSLQFGWLREFAEELSQRIKDASPWFIETMEAVVGRVLKVGYIRTILGRRIKYRDYRAGMDPRKAKAYPFYNYLIQGSAADQTKASQTICDKDRGCETLLLSVHDEGDYSIPATKAGLRRLMQMVSIYENAVQLDVPMICDPEIGTDWGHTEGILKWSMDDYREGLCSREDIDYPKETLEEFWDRMVDKIRKREPVKRREFDIGVLPDSDGMEEE